MEPDVEDCCRLCLLYDKQVTSIFNAELIENRQQRLYSWQTESDQKHYEIWLSCIIRVTIYISNDYQTVVYNLTRRSWRLFSRWRIQQNNDWCCHLANWVKHVHWFWFWPLCSTMQKRDVSQKTGTTQSVALTEPQPEVPCHVQEVWWNLDNQADRQTDRHDTLTAILCTPTVGKVTRRPLILTVLYYKHCFTGLHLRS